MSPIRRTRFRLLAAASLTIALAGLMAIPSQAALAGGGPGACSVRIVGNSLLHVDVQSAVNAAGPGATLEIRGTCLGPVVIAKNLTLVGKATTGTPRPGIYGQESVRVLEVGEGARVTVRKLEIAFGLVAGVDGPGGGILNQGTLTLTNVIVWQNEADVGGGIANLGTLILDGATKVHHNRSVGSGAGIYTVGPVTLRDTAAIFENTSGTYGGGIAASATDALRSLTMHDDSMVRKNTAVTGGGIAALGFTVLLDGKASVRGNIASDSGGGILLGRGRLTLAGFATLRSNRAQTGGAFYSYLDTRPALFLKGSSVVSGNTATVVAAGIHTLGDITMSGSASIRDHVDVARAVVVILGGGPTRPVFTMKDQSRVTHNTIQIGGAAVRRACEPLPTFVGLKSRVKGNTPKNLSTDLGLC